MKSEQTMPDPIGVELLRNALATLAEEMGLAVVRSAYSSAVKEGGDSTAAVFDGRGRLLAQSAGAPLMHLASLRPSLAAVLERFPPRSMQPGDVYISNDQYRGGIHANDVMILRPVFLDGPLPAFFTGALLHVADLGGMAPGGLPGNATDCFQEGLVLPPMQLERAGSPNRDLLALIEANSRTPTKVMGDLRAMLAGTHVGATRLAELAEQRGEANLSRLCDQLLDYTEQRMRSGIAALPDGRHESHFVIDDDGVDPDADHVVRVTVTIEGDRVIADFTGTDPQAAGPINAALSQSMSGVLYAVRCHLDPDIPVNDGCFNPLEMILPYGSLVNPRPPAACNARMATVMAIVEAMLGALAPLHPERAIAGSCNAHVYVMSGRDAESHEAWSFLDPQFGGAGALRDLDGLDVVAPLIFAAGGAMHCVEAYELEYPIRFERFALWQDSGGAGRQRGGLGSQRDIRVLTDTVFNGRATDRCRRPPPGTEGGRDGAGGGWIVNPDTNQERSLPPKITNHPLRAGELVRMHTSAGGGFGDPLERDPSAVLEDVLEGRVSVEGALRDYGVEVDLASGVARRRA
jgi:N-methylhydantoinase B